MGSSVNFRSVVADAMMHYDLTDPSYELAALIMDRLRAHGLAIHKESACIRLPGPPGREMTTEEMISVGLTEGGAE